MSLAHCLLHLGFEHPFVLKDNPQAWNAACDCFVTIRFLAALKIGSPPEDMYINIAMLPEGTEESLYQRFCEQGIPENVCLYRNCLARAAT